MHYLSPRFSEPVTGVETLADIDGDPSEVFYNVPTNDDINNNLVPEFPTCIDECPISQCDSITVDCTVSDSIF